MLHEFTEVVKIARISPDTLTVSLNFDIPGHYIIMDGVVCENPTRYEDPLLQKLVEDFGITYIRLVEYTSEDCIYYNNDYAVSCIYIINCKEDTVDAVKAAVSGSRRCMVGTPGSDIVGNIKTFVSNDDLGNYSFLRPYCVSGWISRHLKKELLYPKGH